MEKATDGDEARGFSFFRFSGIWCKLKSCVIGEAKLGMKLNGTIPYSRADDEKEEEEEAPASEASLPPASIVVGYALTSKKKKSFLKPKLIRLARYSSEIPFIHFLFVYGARCDQIYRFSLRFRLGFLKSLANFCIMYRTCLIR